MTQQRVDELTIERDILVTEVQSNKDIVPGDKDHLRHAINSTYEAATNGDINELAASSVVWTRINLRTFASVEKLVRAMDGLSTEIRSHILATVSSAPPGSASATDDNTRFERRLNAITRLARVIAWPVCLLVAIIATAFILQPELAKIASDIVAKSK